METRVHHLLLSTGFKLVLLVAVTVAVLLVNAASFLFVIVAVSFIGLFLSRVSNKTCLALLKSCAVIIVFVVLAHVIVCDGSGTIALVGLVGLSASGVASAFKAVLRILALVFSLFWLTASLTAAQITSLVQLTALKLRHGGPLLEAFGRILALIVLFFPLCLSQLQSLHEAQELRGATLSKRHLMNRLRSFAPTFASLLVILFQKADKRALALRSRGL